MISSDSGTNKKSYWGIFLMLFGIGALNSIGFSLIYTGAHALAQDFGLRNSIGVIIISVTACEFLVMILNLRYFLGIANRRRIGACCFISVFAYGLLVFITCKEQNQLYIALLAFTVIGMCSSLGECVNLGMLKGIYPIYLYGFSSGRGSARLIAVSLWLLFKLFTSNISYLWITMMLAGLLYYFLFIYTERELKKNELIHPNSELTLFVINNDVFDSISKDTGNAEFSFIQLRKVGNIIKGLAAILSASYFLETFISVGLADRISLKVENGNDENYMAQHNYEFIQLFYYLGAMIGRSCIKVFKVNRLSILIFLQVINLSLITLEAYLRFLPYYIDFVVFFWVGILGGLCYSNVLYQILENCDIEKYFKETASNLALISADFMVLTASGCILIMDNFIIKY